MSINEMGTQFTQETIKDAKNNLLINLVPAHNGRVSMKVVFDGDSDLMLTVQEEEKKCTIERTVLPISTNEAFEKIDLNEQVLTISDSSSDDLPVVERNYIIAEGFEIEHKQLPEKFQPHCPPGFKAISAHTIDLDKTTEEDPYLMNNMTLTEDHRDSAEMYDFLPETHERKKRASCVMLNGQEISSSRCHYVDHNCATWNGVCPNKAYSFKCTSVDSRRCTYILVGCKHNGVEREVCVFHMLMANKECDACCLTRNCGGLVGKC